MRVFFQSFFLCAIDGQSRATLRPLSNFASKQKGPCSVNYRERGFHARGLYITKDTLRMGTIRVIQEKKADTKIIARG